MLKKINMFLMVLVAAFYLSGCTFGNSDTKPTNQQVQYPTTTGQISTQEALAKMKFEFKKPTDIPIEIVKEAALIHEYSAGYQSLELYYFGPTAGQTVTYSVQNFEPGEISPAAKNVTLKNGLEAKIETSNQVPILYWNEEGIYYSIASVIANGDVKPDLTEDQLILIASNAR